MTTANDLNLTPNGMRQSTSLSDMAASASADATAYATDRDPEDINEDAIDILNDLLESCRDGEYGFRECAEHTKAQDIKTVLGQRAEDCRMAAVDLQALILKMGGEPEEGGTASGALHRGWVSVKGTLTGYSDYAMLDECERGEDVALANYRKALKQALPAAARALVEKQSQGAQRNHDQIKAMRDALKVSA